MKRTLIIWGSVGAGVLLVLAMFPAIVSAQTVKSDQSKTSLIKNIKNKINNNLTQGGIIDTIALIIFVFLMITTAFLNGSLFF